MISIKLVLVILIELAVIRAYSDVNFSQEWYPFNVAPALTRRTDPVNSIKIALLEPYDVTCVYRRVSDFLTKEDASCTFPNRTDVMTLTGTMDSRSYCEGEILRSDNFTCDLRYMDKEAFLFTKFFDNRLKVYGTYSFLKVSNAKTLHVVVACGTKHGRINLNNISNVTFTITNPNNMPGCMGSEFLGYNVTIPDYSVAFPTIKLWRSSVGHLNLPKLLTHLIYWKNTYVDTLKLALRKVYNQSKRKRNIIDECVIKTVDMLRSRDTIQVTNSTIGRIKSDSSRLDRFGMNNVTIDTIDRHGLTFLKSVTLVNSTIRNVFQYGILLEPEHPISVHIENVVIDHCRIPCFAHLKTRSGVIDFTIKNVTINGQLFEEDLGKALQMRNYRMPEKMDYLHGGMSQCHKEENSLSCDLKYTKKDYSIIPIMFDNYNLLNISNARDIDVFYECINNFFFKNVSGNFYPIDEEQLKKCSNTMVVELAAGTNIFSFHITTETLVKGSKSYIHKLFAEAPFNISGNKIIITELFNHTIDEGNYLWDGVTFRDLSRLTVNGNLTIINSSFMMQNLIVNNNLTLINCTIRQMNGRVTEGGQLNILDSDYRIFNRKMNKLVIEDGGLVNVDGTNFLNNNIRIMDFSRFTMTRYEFESDERLNKHEHLISISSYDQVIGKTRWYSTSEQWIPLNFQTRHDIPAPNLPAFGSYGPIDYLDREGCTFISQEVKVVCDYSKGRFYHNIYSAFLKNSYHPGVFYDAPTIGLRNLGTPKIGSTAIATYDFIDIYHNETHESDEFNTMLFMPWQGIYQNANILRIQTDIPKMETRVVFRDINKVIFHKTANLSTNKRFIEAATMEFNNISSPHFFSEVGNLHLNLSKIDFLTTFVNDEFYALDSAIGLLSVAAKRIYMNNVTISTLEMLMVDELAIIKNCHIDHINSSAIMSTDGTKFRMINVTIGSIERESLIILDTFHLENVTINSATEDSILPNSVLDSTMKNIVVHSGHDEPFKLLSLETFIAEKISVNGKEYTPISKGGAISAVTVESKVEKKPEPQIQKVQIPPTPSGFWILTIVIILSTLIYTSYRLVKHRQRRLIQSSEPEVFTNRTAVDLNDLPNGLEIVGVDVASARSISLGGNSTSSNDTTVYSHSETTRNNQNEPASSVQFHKTAKSKQIWSDNVNAAPSAASDEFVVLPDDVTLVGGASDNTGAVYQFVKQTRNFFQRK